MRSRQDCSSRRLAGADGTAGIPSMCRPSPGRSWAFLVFGISAACVGTTESNGHATDVAETSDECRDVTGFLLDVNTGCRAGPFVLACLRLDPSYPLTGEECRRKIGTGEVYLQISVPDQIAIPGYSLCPEDIPRWSNCRP